MACDFPAGGYHCRNLFWRAGQSRSHAVDSNWQIFHYPVQAPKPSPGAVFINAFHIPMPLTGPSGSADDLRQKGLGGGIVMQDIVFTTFFVI